MKDKLDWVYGLLDDEKTLLSDVLFYSNDYILDNLYNEMKKFKADQKQKFEEAVKDKKNWLLYEDIEKRFPLFYTTKESYFYDYKKLLKEIEDLWTEINNSKNWWEKIRLKKNLINKKQKAGYLFNSPNNIKKTVQTKKYKEFCDIFKKVAKRRWEYLARIKWYENEKIDSQLIKYWSFIFEEDWNKKLFLIPKSNTNEFKKLVDSNNNKNWEIKFYDFKSFTLRALKKLCFTADDIKGSFRNWLKYEEGLKSNLDFFKNNLLKRYDEFNLWIDCKNNDKVLKNEVLLVKFYQSVLKLDYTRKQVDLIDFWWLDEVLSKNYTKVLDFEIDLEKVCYVKSSVFFSKEDKIGFSKKYKTLEFNISTQDLRIRKDNDDTVIKWHKYKSHTDKWLKFWSKNNEDWYDIKLNPEISIFYREWNNKFKNKIEEKDLKKPEKLNNFKNRFFEDSFILSTSFMINSNDNRMDFAFDEEEKISEKIENFNKNLEEKIKEQYPKNDFWYYWIDRWEKELATLCLTKFSNEKYEVNWKEINKPEFAKIKAYKLKEKYCKPIFEKQEEYIENWLRFKLETFIWNYWERRKMSPVKNVSYFFKNDKTREKMFDKIENISCIDLTAAKIINWEIVLNWDLMTYLKLKELSAKKKIFELHSKWEITSDSEIEDSKGLGFWKEEDKKIYTFTKNGNQWWEKKWKDYIKDDLERYLKNLSFENEFRQIQQIQKINNLRDAITSNMVWIISHLYKTYPWKICLENMDERFNKDGDKNNGERFIDKHFDKNNEFISRRLEWSLYRKFAETWLVPPRIPKSILLKDLRVNNFWIIRFVKIWWTSSICPYCNEGFEYKNGLIEKHIKDNNWWMCRMLKENTDNSFIYNSLYDNNKVNSDSIAWYNIARFWFEEIYAKPKEEVKKDKDRNKDKNKVKEVRVKKNYAKNKGWIHL